MTTAMALVFVLSPWILWALYIMVMGVYRAHLDKRLTTVTKVLAAPWVVIGYGLDVVVNVTVASLIFWEPPSELLVTTRLQRHMDARYGWRYRRAQWICDHLLDPFDPTGNHC